MRRQERGTGAIGNGIAASGPDYPNVLQRPGRSIGAIRGDPLDPKEDKAAVNTDGFKKLYENLMRFYELPNANVANNSFVGGKLAMMAGAVSTGQLTQFAQATQLNWDMASVPVFADKNGIPGLSRPACRCSFPKRRSIRTRRFG
ncbi:hypothetical protein FE784_08600 [Paenibacillus hemerocallicola]|uniref:Uncharacterized protein n=1 Tax=Paenibacillus hemerocallicola TaxID=1172614 RepID=A0A5C4TC13_9BACL|nr:hypothetical protein FE784_08600 [Paenibacillus hemerocallicola]